jgi:hypothetical protein
MYNKQELMVMAIKIQSFKGVMVFNTTFNNIPVISWRKLEYICNCRKPLACRMSLTNFITYRVSSSPRHELDSNSYYYTYDEKNGLIFIFVFYI